MQKRNNALLEEMDAMPPLQDDADVEIRPDKRFQLLAKLISTPEKLSSKMQKYQNLSDLIHKDFLRLCGEIGIPGESALFNELLLLLDDLHDLVEFPHLANKNILAVGGGFSAGKSRFLNTVIGNEDLLPVGLLPTTAIPTFLTSASQEIIQALNTFNRQETISREDLSEISHAFNTGKQAEIQGTISFYHILKLIQIHTPLLKWKNIALLDTPGYSKPHTNQDSSHAGTDAGNTDEEKAREHLSQADHLIWVIAATDGTFQLSDIQFLRDKVRWESPLYILLNKADQRTESDVKKILELVRENALHAGFHLAGISAYSSKSGKTLLGDDPRKWFEEINQKQKFTKWRGRFKAVFDKIIQFNANEENRCKSLKAGLDPVYVKGDAILTPAQMGKLKFTMTEIDKDRKSHSVAASQFVTFSERVENLLVEILQELGIADETASAVGVAGRWQTVAGDLPACQKGEHLAGTVKNIQKFGNKLYIEIAGWQDLVTVNLRDVSQYYTKQWEKGQAVELSVYEINFSDKTIIFTIKPAN